MSCGIYKITNKINNKIYIGQSVNIQQRFHTHCSDALTKQDNNYFLEVMYNYSKIEVITDNYKESLFKSITILNNIKYNDKIIESLIGENTINYNEEEYSYLNPSKNTSSFLEWKEMYGDYKPEPNEIPDEDTIDIKKDE